MVIGLAGVAGAGKDLFFSLLSDKLNCQKFSLADALKNEVGLFSYPQYGIDPLNCTREEKNTIRPLLVLHGTFKRNQSEGRHWIEQLNKKILLNDLNDSIVVITDIRYDDYPKDEVFWLKEELGGVLVHISMYEELTRLNGSYRDFVKPVNSEEARNDPKLKSQADYIVEWKKAKHDKEKELEPYIDGFISWLNGEKDRLSAYKKAEKSRL
tara:strand:- start:123 stop:755 length:633 start_codon:yes stop_codon:yes gene_type:complete